MPAVRTVPPAGPTVGTVDEADRSLWHRWVVAFVLGELIGFLPPALVGVALVGAGADQSWLVVGMTVAGTFEGVAIGVAQAHVLRGRWPAIDRRAWVLATAGAACLAWLVGMGGSTLVGDGVLPTTVAVTGLVIGSILALVAMGGLQWLVLRREVAHSARWIGVNLAAWPLGVAIPVAALSAIPEAWPAAAHVGIAIAAAVAMGLVVSTITGQTLQRFATLAEHRVVESLDTPPSPAALVARFGWTVLSCFVLVSIICGLAALPSTLFYQWHLGLDIEPRPLRLFLLGAAFLPTYAIFAFFFMTLSAEAARLLGWRPPREGEFDIAALQPELRLWARYAILSHLVHVVAGSVFRSTPIWVWYLRRNGARIGRHVWVNSLRIGDDCLLDFGDEVVIGAGAHLSGHTVERGRLKLAPITLGAGTTIGVGAHIGIGVTTGEGTQIGSLSVVPKYSQLDGHTTYVGIPVRPIEREGT